MKTTVGLFASRSDAEDAVARLRAAGIPDDRINLLAPGAERELRRVPTSDTEQPGVGTALGGVVGAAAGAAGGMQAAVAVSALVPGIGPVVALGLLAGALIGAGGGAVVGGAVEDSLGGGVPKDELFLYQDALRQGRTVLFVVGSDDDQAALVRRILYEAGAEAWTPRASAGGSGSGPSRPSATGPRAGTSTATRRDSASGSRPRCGSCPRRGLRRRRRIPPRAVPGRVPGPGIPARVRARAGLRPRLAGQAA